MVKNGTLSPSLFLPIERILSYLYLSWPGYIAIQYFYLGNGHQEISGLIFYALIYCLWEALSFLAWYLFFAVLFGIKLFLVVLSSLHPTSNEKETMTRNVYISNLIKKLDLIHCLGDRFNHEDICVLCFNGIDYEGHTIARLP